VEWGWDWEGESDENENGNAHIRKAIVVQMIEVLEDYLIPDHKRGQILKYNKPNINKLIIELTSQITNCL